MNGRREEAQERIGELASVNPAAADLARLAALCARIEPELLRRLRVDVLATAGADAEADLWFSGVVGARSTSWIVLLPEVAELLREQCAGRFGEPRLERAREVIRWAHAPASALVRMEDEIHWQTMRGAMEPIRRTLETIVAALRSDDPLPVAQWALRAIPRFSASVRALREAWAARLMAAQHLGYPLQFETEGEAVPPEVWPLLRGAMASTEIYARLVENGVELSREPLIGAHRVRTPLAEPVVVSVGTHPALSPRARVMISSSYHDLAEHRHVVAATLARLGLDPMMLEQQPPAEGLSDFIDKADAFIGLLGHRYGPIPEDPVFNPEGLSVTELEYRHALRRGMPLFMFVMSGAPEDDSRLSAFRSEVLSRHAVETFSSPEALRHAVIKALAPLMVASAATREVTVPRGTVVYVNVPAPVQVRTIDGGMHLLEPRSTAVAESVTFRFLFFSHDGKRRAVRLLQAADAVPAVFFAGDAAAVTTASLLFAVPLPERAARPASLVQAPDGDFAATHEIDGARIGIVGLRAFSAESLRAVCGHDPQQWAGQHHFNILLTARRIGGSHIAIGRLFSLHLNGERHEERVSIFKGSGERYVILEADVRDAIEASVTIAAEIRLSFRQLHHAPDPLWEAAGETVIAGRALSRVQKVPRIEHWIFVDGSGGRLSRHDVETARALGAALYAAGYGLITAGRPGFDREVTFGYTTALGGSYDRAYHCVRHYVGALEPSPTLPGRRLFCASDDEAAAKSLANAAAVVQFAKSTGAAVQKPVVPVARNERTRPVDLAARVVAGIAARLRPLFDPRYQFHTFVVTTANQLAFAAAQSVAEAASDSFNPLYIYGGSPEERTHLIQAVGQRMLRERPAAKIIYTSADAWFAELLVAIRSQSEAEFRARYRSVDTLLLEDVQFLAGKERAQDEFFHLFNVLYEKHAQLVLTADRPPKDLPALEERLGARFGWGLVADIQPPDLETKVATLRKRAEERHIALPDDVAEWIAGLVRGNERELEGNLNKIAAFASMTGKPITMEVARVAMRDIFSRHEKPITADQIMRVVAAHYGVRVADLKLKSTARTSVFPRQVAMYLMSSLTDLSFPEIGKQFGKHHSSVLRSVGRVRKLMEQDPQFAETIEALTKTVTS